KQPDPSLTGSEALRQAKWLIRDHAITVLPSVSSLRALRQLAKDSNASLRLIGFGNPLLNGLPETYPEDRARAARAAGYKNCPKQQVASLGGRQRGVRPFELRGGMADVAQIRVQAPLPETADELCEVARDLGLSGEDIWLGARATETEVKRLSEVG